MTKWLLIASLILNVFIAPQAVLGHSFGALYNLPVPFWMYLYGGAAALILSFLVIGYFINKTTISLNYPTYSLSNLKVFSFLTKPGFITLLRVISIFLFLFTIITGIVGEDSAYSNFNMTFFWIIFVLGLTYLTAIAGNVYSIVNPWKILTEWGEKLLGEKAKGIIKYPEKLGYYPALIFYFLFIWIELFGQTSPFRLSFFLIQYTMFNFVGVFLVGKDKWFEYCEFFSVFFRLIGKIAPVEYIPSTSKHKQFQLRLRPPFVGLLKNRADHFSLLLFTLFMLSSTAYDGFRETIPWYRFYWQNLKSVLEYDTFQTIGLLLSPLVFLIIYLVFIALAKIITKSKQSVKELSLQFAFSLIPIAFVYNVAHYYTLILTEGQNFIRILSDPFGFGWNLFNTAEYIPNLAIVDAGVTWHIQVGLILIGHIASVYLAHLVAINIFPSHKKALLSQFPMLFLMVVYTTIGLWVMAQPVTGGTL